MTNNCNLKTLDYDPKSAIVYIAFFDPKIQQDAIELIYHKRNPGKNIQWIIDKREELETNEYLERQNRRLRGAIFRSTVDPIINTIISEIQRRGSFLDLKNQSTIDSIKALKLILDSSWFRKYYSKKRLMDPFSSNSEDTNSTYQFLKEYQKGEPLNIKNIQHLILNMINEIGHCSHTYAKLISLNPDIFPSKVFFRPSIDELNAIGNFDEYINMKKANIPLDFLKEFYSVLNRERISMIDIVNAKEKFLLLNKFSREYQIRKRVHSKDMKRCHCDAPEIPSYRSWYRPRGVSPSSFNVSENPIFENKHVMSQSFVNSMIVESALIPLSVSDIMRKCYHNSSLALEERCETVFIHFQKAFVMPDFDDNGDYIISDPDEHQVW